MAKKRISEAQAKKIVAEVNAGAKPAVLAKKYGFSLGTYYNWRAKFGGKAPKKTAKKAAPKKAAAKKATPKKAAAKKAAPKKAAAKKVAAKRGPKPGAKRGRKPAKRRGRKPAAKKATASTGRSATAIKSQIVGLQGQIKSIEAKIATLKSAYADAVFG